MRDMKNGKEQLNDRVIVALDLPGYDAAEAMVEKLGDLVSFYKVGFELYIRDGERVLELLRSAGKSAFLDLKLHDIPNTVNRAVGSIATKGASLTTLHTAGGYDMMRAARDAADAAGDAAGGLRLIGVTVLTSINEETLRNDMLIESSIPKLVVHLAGVAKRAGLHGVVASALELALLREHFGDDFLVVTPGVRPAGDDVGDQKRIVTPKEAFDRGASYIVVGRPITAAADPAAAAKRIQDEIA
ncbi:MAG: orotidine-5'-phosphate decarboxylase [bacterium]